MAPLVLVSPTLRSPSANGTCASTELVTHSDLVVVPSASPGAAAGVADLAHCRRQCTGGGTVASLDIHAKRITDLEEALELLSIDIQDVQARLQCRDLDEATEHRLRACEAFLSGASCGGSGLSTQGCLAEEHSNAASLTNALRSELVSQLERTSG